MFWTRHPGTQTWMEMGKRAYSPSCRACCPLQGGPCTAAESGTGYNQATPAPCCVPGSSAQARSRLPSQPQSLSWSLSVPHGCASFFQLTNSSHAPHSSWWELRLWATPKALWARPPWEPSLARVGAVPAVSSCSPPALTSPWGGCCCCPQGVTLPGHRQRCLCRLPTRAGSVHSGQLRPGPGPSQGCPRQPQGEGLRVLQDECLQTDTCFWLKGHSRGVRAFEQGMLTGSDTQGPVLGFQHP